MKQIYLRNASGRMIAVDVTEEVARADAETRREIWRSDKEYGRHTASLGILWTGSGARYAAPDVWAEREERLRRNAMRARLRLAWRTLPPEQSELLVKLFVRSQTVREIAREEGVSYQAVQNRRRRVLKKLRKLIRSR